MEIATLVDDEKTALLKMARSFFAEQVAEQKQSAPQDGAARAGAWASLAELGLLGLAISAERGGSDGTAVDLGLVQLALGENGSDLPYAAAMATALGLSAIGTPEVDEVLGEHVSGGALLVPILKTASEALGLGSSPWVDTLASAAEPLPVKAIGFSDGADPQISVHDANADSWRSPVTIAPAPGRIPQWDASGSVLASGPLAESVSARVIALHRVLNVVDLVGGARWMFDTADQYSRQRVQFGHPIGSYQGLQHVLVEMISVIEAAELLALSALDHWGDDDREFFDASAATTAFARRKIPDVIRACYEVLGGVGFMEEHEVNRYNRLMLPKIAALGTVAEVNESVASTIRSSQWL